jgi:hypothetical protein
MKKVIFSIALRMHIYKVGRLKEDLEKKWGKAGGS